MELQGSSQYVNLSSVIKTIINTNGNTPVCTFFNNPCLLHEHTVICIAKYLSSTSTYVYLPDGNRWLTTRDVVYQPDIEKVIECYVDANFASGCSQADSDRIQDSLWNQIYISLDQIQLRTRLNQFEMFLSSLIHERTLKTVLFQKEAVLR